jgi:hypothetical protein
MEIIVELISTEEQKNEMGNAFSSEGINVGCWFWRNTKKEFNI